MIWDLSREKQEEIFLSGKYFRRRSSGVRFQLKYLKPVPHNDAHTGERKEVRVACLSWVIYQGRKKIETGYKFNPFPLEEAVEEVFGMMKI